MFLPLRNLFQGLSKICLLKTFYSLCIAGSHWLALESQVPGGIFISSQKRQLLMINGKIIKVKFSSIFMLFLGLFIYTALQNQRKIYLFSKVLIARRQSTQVLLGIQFIRLQRLLVLLLWQKILSLGINKKWVKRQAMTPDCKQEENVLQTFVFYSSNYILYFLFNVAVFS